MIQEVFDSFKSSYNPKNIPFKNTSWQYYLGGDTPQTVLLLPGILGTTEVLFPYFSHLINQYRVIMPIYPNVYTMAELLQGLHHIIKKEQSKNIILIGSGFGGAVAQCYMRKHPKYISHLILLHSNNMSIDIPEAAFHNRILYLAKMIKFTELMPLAFTQSSYKKNFKKITKNLVTDNQFWKNYLSLLAHSYTKPHMNASLGRLFDFTSNYKLAASDYSNWKGHTLLIEDTYPDGYIAIERESLHLVYPNASIHVEPGLSSINILDKRDIYLQVIENFILESSQSDKIAL